VEADTLYVRVSNSNSSKGQMRAYEVIRGAHYDYPEAALWRWRNSGRTWTFLETAFTSYFLQKVSWVVGKSLLAISTFV